jgi:hypothetical protein
LAGAYNRSLSRGTPVGTGSEYDPRTSPHFLTAASSETVDRQGMKPGQYLGHHGTTIFNPLRSSKEVEAVLGEAKYNPAIEPKSPEQMRVKQAELENRINMQEKQIEILVSALQKQTEIEQPKLFVELKDRTVSELRKEAQEKSLPYVGKNKVQLIEILENVVT